MSRVTTNNCKWLLDFSINLREQEEWENIAENIKSFVKKDPDEQCARGRIEFFTCGLKSMPSGPPTDDDNSPLRRIRSIFLFAAPSPSNNSNLELSHLNLIRVLDLSSMYISSFPLQNLCLILLRRTIWETKEIAEEAPETQKLLLPDPPSSSIDGERNLVWSNVQSVSGLLPYCCTKKVLSRIQNIKKLCIRGHVYDYSVHKEDMDFRDLVDLHQLETLSIKVDHYHVGHWSSRFHKSAVYVPSAIHFPTKLKKLKLVGTRLPWEDLDIIGQWPNLEVLKLKPNACSGLEWSQAERRISLDIYSLQLIELQNCNVKLVASAGRIQEEQESLGSKAVDVRSYSDPAECELSGSDSDSD
ncbi:hypothetical protein HAX54_006411 [Datura stramonium]|uniref:Uncharacterized protein n=1 Tax=Datura stramonium TaxID=4076 RepID=A0ABS8TBI1_DATST|nr:hypothetical protein [Datura stramonium]